MMQRPLPKSEIDEMVAGLSRLARNLWWTWNQESQEFFQELSPRGWRNMYHNPVAILHEVSEYELRVRLHDPEFAQRARRVLQLFQNYLGEKNTWGRQHAAVLLEKPVAYFSMEFGFHESLPIAAGGLGVLAADHAKSASDLGISFVGISLFYREGYFQQAINHENSQTEFYANLHPDNMPMEAVLDESGKPLVCQVQIALKDVHFRAWRVNVGRIPVYLLDANCPENEGHYRDLTRRVYGGDTSTRIMQELLLGVGGVRFLRTLGLQPSVFHMNEGHAAFLVLELTREKMAQGATFQEAFAQTRQECIFTTHTPVDAGHDRFSSDLMNYAANRFEEQLGLSHEELMGLGRVQPKKADEPFCMTVLALRASRAANGVSELHGRVSRQMWRCLYLDRPVDEVPIGHITNGVHLLGWMKGPVRRFWRRKLSEMDQESTPTTPGGESTRFWRHRPGSDWESVVNSPQFWQRMSDPNFISDEEIWAMRFRLRRELIEFSRRRLLLQGHTVTQDSFITFDAILNTDALTIGFGRRFATYKRAPLIFQRFDDIVKLAKDKNHPVQFIFAGKAHPRDEAGKRFIQYIIHLSKFSELYGRLVFIENYDIHVARQMTSGCDVWLNNPRRPLEASGTSGMKTACHGCLNLSILDGWWREGYDGTNGFSIGDDSHPDSVEEQDRRDSENLYHVLTEEVVPCFYEQDENGIPRRWIQKIRRAMVTLVPQFDTWRMVQEYTTKYYCPQSQPCSQSSTAAAS
jgi:starch phosphorylase